MGMNYIGYYRKTIMNTLIASIVWAGLSTYVIISKGQIGENNIPIFETIMFLIGIATSRYVANNKINYTLACTLDVIVDFIMLSAVLLSTLYYGISAESAICLYILIILVSNVTGIMTRESARDLEDRALKTEVGKKFLKIARGWHRDFSLYGLTIGSALSLFLLTYLHMDLKTYAILLISLNIFQVFYDAYLIKKYLY